ncbi:MAG: MauE/DoxX family redox-associated membrane protein [Terriglobia bacterium]
MTELAIAGRLLLAVIFGLAGFLKWERSDSLRPLLQHLGTSWGERVRPIALCTSMSELVVAVFLAVGIRVEITCIAVACLVSVFTGVMVVALKRGYEGGCGCFGDLDTGPISTLQLCRNLVLAAVAVGTSAAVGLDPAVGALIWRLPARAWAGCAIVVPSCLALLVLIGQINSALSGSTGHRNSAGYF